jgi:hypothetical protein
LLPILLGEFHAGNVVEISFQTFPGAVQEFSDDLVFFESDNAAIIRRQRLRWMSHHSAATQPS